MHLKGTSSGAKMNLTLSMLILTIVGFTLCSSDELGNKLAPNERREGRAVAGNGGGNSLNAINNANGNSNLIEHSSSKSRIELEKRQIQEFLTAKNIFKSLVKLLFGNAEEMNATSRHLLGIAGKLLDLLKSMLGQKSRSGTARTMRDSLEDAAIASASVLQGYVKAVLANDDRCAQRYLCQASKEATRDSRDLGYMIATVGGYATSYMLDNSSRAGNFKSLHEASMKGRLNGEDCAKLYAECTEQL